MKTIPLPKVVPSEVIPVTKPIGTAEKELREVIINFSAAAKAIEVMREVISSRILGELKKKQEEIERKKTRARFD